MSHRQTVSYLRQRFDDVGLSPDTRHGQNFLIDLNLVNFLVDAAQLEPRDVVLEIGTGTGSLTALMAPRVASVVTVEIDANVQQLAAEELAGSPNVVMLLQDALKNKNRFAPEVLAAVEQQLAVDPERRLKLVANLPYNVATPIVSNLLLTPFTPALMVVTIQKELAERITAAPSTKDYSALSVWMQSLCDVELLRILGPTVFWPRPKVDSAIIRVTPRAEKRARFADLPFYHTFVRSLFFHRRKFLRSVLRSSMKGRLEKEHIDAVMDSLGLGPESRAEELPVERIIELAEAVRLKLNEVGG